MGRIAAVGLAILVSAGLSAQTSKPADTRPDSRPTFRAPVEIGGGTFRSARNGSRLVVLIVVDQLAIDVLRSAWPFLGEDGFRRLEREGTFFPNCAYRHACSETGPGHATLATGAVPATHGIVGNEWIDASTAELVGCCEDRATRLLSSSDPGASAHHLLAPTFGDALKAAFGSRAKVVTISIKDRSAVFMAGASADNVVWFDRKTGLFTTSTAFVSTDTGPEVEWLNELNGTLAPGSTTEFAWEKVGAPEAYEGLTADDDPGEYALAGSRTFPHHLRRADAKSLPEFSDWLIYSPAGLEMLFEHARFLLDKTGLGKDEVPDFFGISFSSTDLVGHLFGPDSHEVRDMTLRMDRILAALLLRLDEAVGRGKYNVILSADHGMAPRPEIAAKRGLAAGRVNIDKVRGAIESALRERYGAAPAGQHWVAKILDADVLLNRKLIESGKLALSEVQDHAGRAAATVPGVAEAIPVHAIFEGALTPTEIHDCVRRSQVRSRSVDLYVLPKPYHLFGRIIATHGSPYDYDRRVPLFLSGPGIKAGCRCLDEVAPGSAVVTMAELLGIAGPGAADHPLLESAIDH